MNNKNNVTSTRVAGFFIGLIALLGSTHLIANDTGQLSNKFIQRAVLTTEVTDREPVDNLNATAIDENTAKVYFFTEVTDLSGQSITHRWSLDGKVQAEVSLNIGSNRWRTYSSKNLVPILKGTWLVEAVDEQNRVIASTTFTY